MCGQVNYEEYEQEPPIRTETLNTEKQKPPKQTKTKNTENRNTTVSSAVKMLTQEDKMNVELIKKIMREKGSTLPSHRNQYWKKVKV